MKTAITIIGTGWISTHFLKKYENDISVIASTSKSSRKPNASIKHFNYDIYNPSTVSLPESDVCIITLPFSRSLTNPSLYSSGIKQLLSKRTLNNYDKVIFTSSTSIYPNNQQFVNESSPIDTTDRALALNDIEQYLLRYSKQAFILRLSGICGDSRYSSKSITKKQINNAQTPMNLIHIDDITNVLMSLCNHKHTTSDILNVTCTDTPTRDAYYRYVCAQLKVPTPCFDSHIGAHKIVSNKKLLNQYGIQLIHPTPLSFSFKKP